MERIKQARVGNLVQTAKDRERDDKNRNFRDFQIHKAERSKYRLR